MQRTLKELFNSCGLKSLKINVKFLKPILPENHSYDSLTDAVQTKVSEYLKKNNF